MFLGLWLRMGCFAIINALIQSHYKYYLSTCSVPETVQGTKNININNTLSSRNFQLLEKIGKENKQ